MKPEFISLSGLLRGNGFTTECEVRVEVCRSWNLQGFPNPPIYGKHEIVWWDADLQDGQYQLEIHNTIHDMLLSDGRWTQVTNRRAA
jgi:hypothetical protein